MTLHQDGAGEPDQLDRLWTPHRMAYIRGENKPADASSGECPFCRVPSLGDEEGLVVRRGELVARCWDELSEPGSNVVDVLVGQLRRKLGSAELVETVRGVGYRLAAEPPVG